MKKLLMVLLLVSMMSFVYAVPFDSGSTGGTVSIPGDYASLKLAADAFNALATGIQANWTISITADLTEAENVAFGNLTNGFTVTIKPAASVSPKITFSATTAAGIYGHLVFGVKQITADPVEADYFETVNGYVIDGNNGGTPGERNLTIESNAGSTTGRIITIFGKTDGVIIKNTIINQVDTSGTSWCVRWAGGSMGTKMNVAANGGRIENCQMIANVNPAGVAVSFSPVANGTELAAGSAFNNMEFINNDIQAGQRGIFLDSVANCTIKGNKITLIGRTGYQTIPIYHWDANDYANYTITIEDNILDITTPNATAGQGSWGILIDSNTDLTNTGIVNINNNIIKNFAFTATSALDQIYRGFVLNRARVTYNVEHNTINMPSAAMVTGGTAGYVNAFYCAAGATATINLKNNLVRFGQAGTNPIVWVTAGAIVAEGNNMVSAGGAPFGSIVGTPYADFAAWQAAGYDTAATKGQSVDPTTTVPAWNADCKFDFYGVPSPMVGVASSTILTDIDGDVRPAAGATPGADEPKIGTPPTPTPIPLSAKNMWRIYE